MFENHIKYAVQNINLFEIIYKKDNFVLDGETYPIGYTSYLAIQDECRFMESDSVNALLDLHDELLKDFTIDNADFYDSDDEDENHFSAINSVADNYTTEDWFFRLQQKEKLINALGKLSKTDKKLIKSRYGICLNCLGNLTKSTMSKTSMALDMTESGAEKKLKTIMKKLRKALQE